jgi:hypothetical protein
MNVGAARLLEAGRILAGALFAELRPTSRGKSQLLAYSGCVRYQVHTE